jgi:hypothetical protein
METIQFMKQFYKQTLSRGTNYIPLHKGDTHTYTRHQTDTSEIKVEAASFTKSRNCLRERRGAHREEVKSRENSLCAIGIYNNPFCTIQN